MSVPFKARTYIASIVCLILILSLLFVKNSDAQISIRLLIGGVIGYTLFFYLFKTGVLDHKKQHGFSRLILYVVSIFSLLAGINYFSSVSTKVTSNSFFDTNTNAWLTDFFGILLAFLIFYIIFSSLYLLWDRKQSTRNDRLETELITLKNQINPHFYFNSLNNLYSLIRSDQDQAQKFVLKLSDLMRYTIYEGGKETVAIKDEVSYLKNYIDLQVSRFERDIEVNFTSKLENPEAQLSPLLFINLLENAFKHGVEKLIEGASLDITIEEIGGEVVFKISNAFDKERKKAKRGIGIQALKNTLNLSYPNRHSLKFETSENIYYAELRLST